MTLNTDGIQVISESRPRPRWLAPAIEFGGSIAMALAFFATCYLIKIKPTERTAQVAGLAALGYRFVWFVAPMLGGLIAIAKYRPAWWDLALRFACGSLAGLVSAFVAGGVLCMLRGTPYGLGGNSGDPMVLAEWARLLMQGEFRPGFYPPLQTHLLVWMADLQGVTPLYAMKYYQLTSVLAFGPAAYAAWRLLLRPTWALGIGVIAALPLLEPYRQHPLLVLVVFIPIAIKFLDVLRGAAEREPRWLAIRGAVFGAGLGGLFLLYSGWFQWSAPGFFLAALVVFPWRTAPRRGAVLCGAAVIAFVAVTGYYLSHVIAAPPIRDGFQYFDSQAEPMYFAMWRGDLPGVFENLWPPPGELGGVGLFTVVLCAGWAASIAQGARRIEIIAVSWIVVGTWLLRLWYAHRMWQTKLVQLYPRTTAELVYCLCAATGFAIYFYAERRRADAPETSPLRTTWGPIGALCGISLLFMSAGSAITDRYMPREAKRDSGHLAWLSHKQPREELNQAIGGTASVTVTGTPELAAPVLVDQNPTTEFETAPGPSADGEVSIVLQLPRVGTFSRVALLPSTTGGFPVDFTVDVWDGVHWLPRASRKGYKPTTGPQSIEFGRSDHTDMVRVHVTRLGAIGNQFGLRLGEVEVYR
jgi:galactan 5-O-arabinofuranosyltransferase